MATQKRTVPVLLLEDSDHLGHVGDVVQVKPGFARNFLFPNGRACPVTQAALRAVERSKKKAAETRAQRAAELAELAEGLEGLSLMLEQKASEEGHLFGSVGVPAIAAALAEKGVSVQEKQIALDAPIKELGIYNVAVAIEKDRTVDIRVWIVEPEE